MNVMDRLSWNGSSVCTLLYYRKLIPIVSDENTDRWGGLGGTAPTARSRPLIVSHPRFEPGYPEILDHRWTCTIFLVRDLRDIVISDGPLDHLDHAPTLQFVGGKIGIDATAKSPAEGAREWPPEIEMTREIRALVDRRWAEYGLDA